MFFESTNKNNYEEYEAFLKLVRERNQESKIIVLSPFCGAMDAHLPDFIEN